jgi:ankyrin repeat protein
MNSATCVNGLNNMSQEYTEYLNQKIAQLEIEIHYRKYIDDLGIGDLLSLASKFEHAEAVAYFLKQRMAAPLGSSPPVTQSNLTVLQFLQSGRLKGDIEDDTLRAWAIKNGYVEIVKLLSPQLEEAQFIDLSKDSSEISALPPKSDTSIGYTNLGFAQLEQTISDLEMEISYRAHLCNLTFDDLLYAAFIIGDRNAVAYFLSCGARLPFRPFPSNIEFNSSGTIRFRRSRYFQPNALYDTPLAWAAGKGYEEIVRLLLYDEELDPNQKDGCGVPPLIYAAANNHLEILQLLLIHGADTNQMNDAGATALIYATDGGYFEVIKCLLKFRANVEHQEQECGYTALEIAKLKEYGKCVELLEEWVFKGKESEDQEVMLESVVNTNIEIFESSCVELSFASAEIEDGDILLERVSVDPLLCSECDEYLDHFSSNHVEVSASVVRGSNAHLVAVEDREIVLERISAPLCPKHTEYGSNPLSAAASHHSPFWLPKKPEYNCPIQPTGVFQQVSGDKLELATEDSNAKQKLFY